MAMPDYDPPPKTHASLTQGDCVVRAGQHRRASGPSTQGRRCKHRIPAIYTDPDAAPVVDTSSYRFAMGGCGA
jgi:hypothetical protein